jgi:hypothetical protein
LPATLYFSPRRNSLKLWTTQDHPPAACDLFALPSRIEYPAIQAACEESLSVTIGDSAAPANSFRPLLAEEFTLGLRDPGELSDQGRKRIH